MYVHNCMICDAVECGKLYSRHAQQIIDFKLSGLSCEDKIILKYDSGQLNIRVGL